MREVYARYNPGCFNNRHERVGCLSQCILWLDHQPLIFPIFLIITQH